MRKISKIKNFAGLLDAASIPLYQDGGLKDIGGYDKDTRGNRVDAYRSYDPTGGFNVFSQIMNTIFKNMAKGEENEFYKAYLGLPNALLSESLNSPNSFRTEWDSKVNRNADFYRTTPRMDRAIQAYVDTLNLGKIYRNFDKYKDKLDDTISKENVRDNYEFAKKVLEDDSGKWIQADADAIYPINSRYERELDELNPLGMLAKFGIRWDKKNKQIQVHDHYDFPNWVTTFSKIPKRPNDMLIRGKISFDPKKGSIILRDGLKHFNDSVPAQVSDLEYRMLWNGPEVIFDSDPEWIDLNHYYSDGGIYIKKKNRGKFTETMKRTGKSAEELKHSKNPLTRKRATFAINARKWAKNK